MMRPVQTADILLSHHYPMQFKRLATTEVSALVERLAAAMTTEIEAATKTTQAAADNTLAEARAELEQVTAALMQARDSERTVLATIDQVRPEVEALRVALENSRAEKQMLEETLEKARRHDNALQSTIQKLQADEMKRQEKVGALELAVQKVRDRCAIELEKVTTAKALSDAQYQKAREAWLEETRAVREATATAASAELEYLRAAFPRLDAASTVAEGLNVLVGSLAAAFPRVALFHVNGNRLEGRQQTGFDFENDISNVIIPLTEGSVFHEPVESGRTRRLGAADIPDATKTLFGGAPSNVLILPVVIEATTVAVLYADDSGQSAPEVVKSDRVGTSAEILLLHAVPLLARLSAHERLVAYERRLLNDLQIV
jgi:hypothetical protein